MREQYTHVDGGTISKTKTKQYRSIWESEKEKARTYIYNWDAKETFDYKVKNHIGLFFVADMHLGGSGVDYESAERDAKLIGKTPGAMAVLGGDGIDNFIKIISAMINSGTSPKEQLCLLEHYLSFFNGRILAMIGGNHDRWTKEVSGLDSLSGIAKDHKIMYNADEFLINITCGGILYRVLLRHKYRFNSSMNLTHTVKQMLRFGDHDFDIGVVCHHHEADIETFQHHKTTRLAIRTGSYKIRDPYSRKEGFNKSEARFPMVILNPYKRDFTVFQDVESGCDYLKFLRKNNA